MEYEVEREINQYHVREKGQTTRGTTLTDAWLKQMGYWPLSRLNIDHAIRATYAMVGGVQLTQYEGKDVAFVPGFKNYPSTPTTGRLPRNPQGIANTKRVRIPERLLFRG